MNLSRLLVYIAVTAVSTYLIRVIPLVAIQKKIENRFFRSFLYYVPYVTLSIMTFPAILEATDNIWAGLAALVCGTILAYFGVGLFGVAISSCVIVFVLELFL